MVLSVRELAEKFGMSETTVRRFCAVSGSPAMKAGLGKKAPWVCDEDSFEQFLLAIAEEQKN